jgi:hypothetical protein
VSLRAFAFAAPLLCLAACTKEDGTSAPTAEVARNAGKSLLPSLGKRLAKSNASELRLAPGGKVATWLADAEKPRLNGIPPQMRVGELWAVGVDGGAPWKLANGVINVPGGWLFSPDGRWALVLEGYNAAAANGTLVAVDLQTPGSAPVRLGGGVTYALGSPDSSRVAWVEGGVLKVGPLPGGPFRSVAGEVSTASFTPDGRSLIFRRKLAAAGGLFLAPVEDVGAPRKLADHVADFELSPDGTQLAFSARSDVSPSYNDLFLATAPSFAPRRIALQAWRFGFSPDGRYLARTEGWKSSDEAGDLFVGPSNGEGARKVGEKIGRFSFAPDSSAVAFLEFYDPNANGGAGVLGVADLPEGKPRRVGNRVPNYAWGADGRCLAFLSRFMKPVYSVDLMLYVRGEERSVKIRQGAYGYSFSPDNAQLYFRTNCVRDGRACDLVGVAPDKVLGEVQAADGGTPDPASQPQLLEGLYTFAPSKDGSRLLVTYPRWEAKTYDVATFNVQAKQRRSLDSLVQVPPAFASDDGRKVVYVVEDGERSGVYLAQEE